MGPKWTHVLFGIPDYSVKEIEVINILGINYQNFRGKKRNLSKRCFNDFYKNYKRYR